MKAKGGQRMGIGALAVSAALMASIAGYEGYRERAYIPVLGDKATIAHGTTVYPDGKPVKLGDTVTPERAMDYLRSDTDKFAVAVKRCAPVPMFQYEFDAFVSVAYNIGEGAFCKSSMARKLKRIDYAGACKSILLWDKFKGKALPGLTKRRAAEYKLCMGQ